MQYIYCTVYNYCSGLCCLHQLGTLCLFGVFKYEFSFRAYRIQTDVFFFFSFYFILTTKN